MDLPTKRLPSQTISPFRAIRIFCKIALRNKAKDITKPDAPMLVSIVNFPDAILSPLIHLKLTVKVPIKRFTTFVLGLLLVARQAQIHHNLVHKSYTTYNILSCNNTQTFVGNY